ncbi:hypothetical protein FDUTEX481_08756 [Tolypothrix sp. PCC 7601]|nr:hypothetical protein FDUTEX481_08756 [Tolypothrix sp. PCC 7601]
MGLKGQSYCTEKYKLKTQIKCRFYFWVKLRAIALENKESPQVLKIQVD